MAADDDEGLPDPDQVPPAVIGLDGLLAVVVAGTLVLLVSGHAWRHVGAALALAVGVAVIAIVVRMIVRRERRAGRRS